MPAMLGGTAPKLKYLFTATFQDGTVIQQDEQDKSPNDPEGKKSQFWDVLEYEKHSPLIKFSLKKKILGLAANEASVDLLTGKFSINGTEFDVADQNFVITQPLRIVYFRETQKQQDVHVKTHTVIEERHFINRYFIGWQTTWLGKNYQCAIGIDGR